MPDDAATLKMIGRRLREERERSDLTLDEAVRELGLSHRSQLSRMERGGRGVDSLVLRRASALYGVGMEDFFHVAPDSGLVVKARRNDADDVKAQAMADFARRKLADWRFVSAEIHDRGF